MKRQFTINGEAEEFELETNETLLQVLRKNGHVEVKNGCEEGECGACLVLLDDLPVNSCQVLAMSVGGRKITTVKGIGTLYQPSVIQEAYVEAGAVQCGFCTPGMVISTWALLKRCPEPTEADIAEALGGNLCRCTGYVKIVDAVRLAAKKLKERV